MPNKEEHPPSALPPEEYKEGGWLKLWRCLRDNPMWAEMPYSTGKLWLWLLMDATHEGQEKRLKYLQPGQMTHSVDFICEALEWIHPETHKTVRPSDNTVRKGLKRLVAEGMITWEPGGGGGSYGGGAGRITICNWSRYQSKEGGGSATSSATESGTVSATESAQLNKYNKTKKEDKNAARAERLALSPHYEFVRNMCNWFYTLPHLKGKIPTLTEANKLDIKATLIRILEEDMGNEPGCELRLKRLIEWAVEDEVVGAKGKEFKGWKHYLKSLASLRTVGKGGAFKWANIEDAMPQVNGYHGTSIMDRILSAPSPQPEEAIA